MFSQVMTSKLCWCGMYTIFHVSSCAGYVKDSLFLIFAFLTIDHKKNSWPVISVHFVRGPKWIDASKIKKPRSHATEHWHALTFQIHTHCTWGLMMMYVCIYVLTFKFNFGSSWSVYTRPCLKAKNNGYTIIIILSCVMHDTKLAHFPSGIGLCDLSLGE